MIGTVRGLGTLKIVCGFTLSVTLVGCSFGTKKEPVFATLSSAPSQSSPQNVGGLETYEKAMVRAIAMHWWGMLDHKSRKLPQNGEVVIQFLLHDNGTVADVRVAKSTIGNADYERLCCRAVEEVAPFAQVPDSLRDEFSSPREVSYTFYF